MVWHEPQWIDLLKTIGTIIATGYVSLKVAAQSNQFAKEREHLARVLGLEARKLDEFYGPMLSILTELRERVALFKDARQVAVDGITAAKEIENWHGFLGVDFYRKQFDIIEPLERKRYAEKDVELLDKLIRLFHDKYYLANPTTTPHLKQLIRLSELWYLRMHGGLDIVMVGQIIEEKQVFDSLEKELREQQTACLNRITELQATVKKGIVARVMEQIKLRLPNPRVEAIPESLDPGTPKGQEGTPD